MLAWTLTLDTGVLIKHLGVKQPKKFSTEAFSDAMTKILASTLTGSDKRVSLWIA